MRLIRTKRTFNYPKEFTSLPEYSAHRGQAVRVLRRLTSDECDAGPDLEAMYKVRAADGWLGDAYKSELGRIRK